MVTFTLRLPWWPIVRLFSHNPLVRTVDRVEAVFVLAAVTLSLLGAPVAAAAVGTVVHDARSHLYAQQAQTRHALTATGTDADAARAQPAPTHEVFIVTAQWPISGGAHSGAVKPVLTIHPSDQIGIWVDDTAQQVDEPAALSHAANEAVAAALVVWVIVIAAAAGLLAIARAMANHVRNTGWQHDIDKLLCCGGGQPNTQP
jgi:hypothetical protein